MRKLKQLTLTVLILISFSSVVNAETFLLEPDIFVGFSFWTVSMVCLAATVFFFLREKIGTNKLATPYYSCSTYFWYFFCTLHILKTGSCYPWWRRYTYTI